MLDISLTKLTLINFVNMRNNSQDSKLERNYLEKYCLLINGYEQVKNKSYPFYKKTIDFCKANHICAKSFLRYYYLFNKAENQ